jgi:hypothetical protein
LIVAIILIAIIIFVVARRRGKKKAPAAPSPTPAPAKATPAYSPTPTPAYNPSPASAARNPASAPAPVAARVAPVMNAGDQGMTIDLSRTVAISPEMDTAQINYGSIRFVSGALAGKQFEIKPEGEYMGRDSSSSQVVIPDPRISKRHLWIGVRDGRVIIVDQDSRNGTFVNDPKSARVKETSLNSGDTVILGESDVARFEYVN